MDAFLIQLLNGLSSGLLLFMLSAGLTLIFGMMGVLNFAHASFYMLGAYLAYTLAGWLGFWLALVLVPLLVGALGALFQRSVLRAVQPQGHVAELLVTFGAAYVIAELIKLFWGHAPVPFEPPALLQGSAFTLIIQPGAALTGVWGAAPAEPCAAVQSGVRCTQFPLTRLFMMGVALLMLLALWVLLAGTRTGLVIRAALTHPQMVQALGHDVPRVTLWLFGAGCALAGLAGAVGGMVFVTEPSMALVVGSILFVVVVVGGLGSLSGAFVASLLIGLLQTLPLMVDGSLLSLLQPLGWAVSPTHPLHPVLSLTLAQLAPLLPFLLLVIVLIVRPRGLMGLRET
ncbi:MAG: branched-chain amino acid ABC transporter permease [Rubrivivax sp.]|nr:branched-chain amino acid ABC transporter permease [Rubrivivax sp.]